MDQFNSSDIICVSKNKDYLGVSLKKKKHTKADPTLINLALNRAFAFDSGIIEYISEITNNFFCKLLKDNFNRIKGANGLTKASQITTENWRKYIDLIKPQALEALKSDKSIFIPIISKLKANANNIADILLDTVLKTSLKELKKKNFDFALCTGIGDYTKRTKIRIWPAHYVDIDTMSTVISDLVSKGKPTLSFNKSSFVPGGSYAGIRFTLSIGKFPVCDMEIRYKGKLGADPSFTATLSDAFKNVLEE